MHPRRQLDQSECSGCCRPLWQSNNVEKIAELRLYWYKILTSLAVVDQRISLLRSAAINQR